MAIKLFTDAAGFANEERAYGIKAVAEAVGTSPTFMPNSDLSAMMPNGLPFPPYTVAEKGQPLDVWMGSYSADPITSMQVRPMRSQPLALMLRAMHVVFGEASCFRASCVYPTVFKPTFFSAFFFFCGLRFCRTWRRCWGRS